MRSGARHGLGRREGWAVEGAVFVVKQGWAALFGGLMLLVLLVTRLYPDGLALARNDLLVLLAALIQVAMLVSRLETPRELRVILLFHLVGTVMELFKTAVGSWAYPDGGVLRIGGVPLWSGFMYAAVGSYMVRVHRLFDLRFSGWPPLWLTSVVAVGAYVNFFTHHWLPDLRWPLVLAVAVVWGRAQMHVRVHRRVVRMPVLASFVLVAVVIWLAENVATFAGGWLYPNQQVAWDMVHAGKISSWFLLMTLSVVLVTWVYPPRGPDAEPSVDAKPGTDADVSRPAGTRGGTAAASPTR
nr:DUF817 domain-containing protein [Ornithinimicrobium tianjinense]